MEYEHLLGFGLLLIGTALLRVSWTLFCLWLYDCYGINIAKINLLYNKIKERP